VICGIAGHDANELGLFVAGADHYFTVEAFIFVSINGRGLHNVA
jgi:hypothetical protein